MSSFTDRDFQRAMHRAVMTACVLTAVALPLTWWKAGWQSALLLLVGAAISTSGLWEWRRLMTAVAVRMDAESEPAAEETAKKPSMAFILITFFLRLGLAVVVLYVTLKYLQGSVFALAAGLVMGVTALLIEAVRLLRSWTL